MSESTVHQPQNDMERLRAYLRPRGSAPLIGLHINGVCYVNEKLVYDALDELEKLPMIVAIGGEVSPLQKIAIMLLKDSADIK